MGHPGLHHTATGVVDTDCHMLIRHTIYLVLVVCFIISKPIVEM